MIKHDETRFAVAYDCPPCGKQMTKAGGDIWVCPSGHMRKTHELTGVRPWKDSDGIWHNLTLLGPEGR